LAATCEPRSRNAGPHCSPTPSTTLQIGIFGTGIVDQTIASALVAKENSVMIGTRDPSATLARDSGNDLGDITNARGTEMLLPIWRRLWGKLGTPMFNCKIAR